MEMGMFTIQALAKIMKSSGEYVVNHGQDTALFEPSDNFAIGRKLEVGMRSGQCGSGNWKLIHAEIK